MKLIFGILFSISFPLVAGEGWHPPMRYDGPQYSCTFVRGAGLLNEHPFELRLSEDGYYNVVEVQSEGYAGPNRGIGRVKHAGPCPSVVGKKCHFGYEGLFRSETLFVYFGSDIDKGNPRGELILDHYRRKQGWLDDSSRERDEYRCELSEDK